MKFYNGDSIMSVMETVGDPIGDYTIVNRFTSYLPWVCAWRLKVEETEPNELPNAHWGQGYYFEKFEDAVQFAIEKTA